jgi:D-aminoacyl-tRNA deacylase
MNILLITSEKDVASSNFYKVLLDRFCFNKVEDNLYLLKNKGTENKIFLKNIKELHIFSEENNILDNNDYDIIIFLSKHSTLSKIKKKYFCVHAIGNFGDTLYGGKPKTLVETDGFLIRHLLLNLKKNKPKELEEYIITQEATHHGPYINKKALFFEIGSDIEDWNNLIAIDFLSKILINSLLKYSAKKFEKKGWISVCGYGGSHYCTVFNKYTFNKENNYSFGHIVPSYATEDFKKNKLFDEIKKKGFSKKILKENLKEL